MATSRRKMTKGMGNLHIYRCPRDIRHEILKASSKLGVDQQDFILASAMDVDPEVLPLGWEEARKELVESVRGYVCKKPSSEQPPHLSAINLRKVPVSVRNDIKLKASLAGVYMQDFCILAGQMGARRVNEQDDSEAILAHLESLEEEREKHSERIYT